MKDYFFSSNVEFLCSCDYTPNCFKREKTRWLFSHLSKCGGKDHDCYCYCFLLDFDFVITLSIHFISTNTKLWYFLPLMLLIQDYIRILNRPLVLSKTNDFFQTTFFSRDHLVGGGPFEAHSVWKSPKNRILPILQNCEWSKKNDEKFPFSLQNRASFGKKK